MTSYLLVATVGQFILGLLLTLTSIFLILMVLVQRGRGGGLTGALGGMGGQSAFGAKAGDTFTYITVGVAGLWILLGIISVRFLGGETGPLGEAGENVQTQTTDGEGPGSIPGAEPVPPDPTGDVPASGLDDAEATGGDLPAPTSPEPPANGDPGS